VFNRGPVIIGGWALIGVICSEFMFILLFCVKGELNPENNMA